jgi:hypothetical protein
MARKRSSPAGSSSPNAVLVVFLVLFILATLGLGGWVYSIFGERHKYEEMGKKAEAKISSNNKAKDWALLQSYEIRNMLGEAALQDDKSNEFTEWKTFHAEAFNDADGQLKLREGGKFDAEAAKDREAFRKLVETARKDLDWDPTTHRFKTTYRDRLTKLEKERDDARSERAKLQQEKIALEQKLRSLDEKGEKGRAEQLAAIKSGNKAALEAVEKQSDLMTKQIEQNNELRKKMDENQQKLLKEIGKRDTMISDLKDQLFRAGGGTGMAANGGEKGPKGPPKTAEAGVQPHALLLDVSKGKPLWDRARGKILRVDEKERRVTIDKGSADGIKPGLSFNVFGEGWEGRSEGPLKGTIEVVRVGPRSSTAKITSLYDALGNEISMNDPSPSRITRGAGNPLKEGDLLFNLVWGSHVVVAGVVDWSGRGAETAAAQQDELQQFLRMVESQGIIVDAYVDLRDGQVKGALTGKTAYLIAGLKAVGRKGPDEERATAVNAAAGKLRNDAIERGLFMISPDNFANVVGYRRPRSRTDAELTHFRPGMPAAGVSLEGLGEGAGGVPLSDIVGRWAGKLAGGGQLRLNIKTDGGCVWQLVVGADTLTGFSNVGRAGKDFAAVIQNRPATLRVMDGGATLQVTGGGVDATLRKE